MLDQAGTRSFTPREDRRRTMLRARMRSRSGWADACILNVSSSGLLVYADTPVGPGTFVELRRGGHLVIAKVVWRKNQRIGLCSTDEVPVDAILSDEIISVAAKVCTDGAQLERRRSPREPDTSRARGRAIEFVFVAAVAVALASAAAFSARQVLAAPMSIATSAL